MTLGWKKSKMLEKLWKTKKNVPQLEKITVKKHIYYQDSTIHFYTYVIQIVKAKNVPDKIVSYISNKNWHEVKNDRLSKPHRSGGLKMTNIEFFIKSLKTTWIKRCIQIIQNFEKFEFIPLFRKI